MRILITNDDGIHAPGLAVLERIAASLSEDVWIVAPEADQSGVAHSLSLSDPLRVRQADDRRFAVKGTPTDCVIMGVLKVLADKRPDLILSGVNRGQNVAEDVTYSGTIAAAMEGTLLGIPSVALSQAYGGAEGRRDPPWDCAERHGAATLRRVLDAGVPAGTLINVNFPACAPEEVGGVAVTAQGKRPPGLIDIEGREDGRGNPYYWLSFGRRPYEPGPGTDLAAMRDLRISVTPLRLDLTDDGARARLGAAFG